MPSLISSRQMAGHPTARAIWCARVVLPEPGGPLTTMSVGEVKAAIRPMCPAVGSPHEPGHRNGGRGDDLEHPTATDLQPTSPAPEWPSASGHVQYIDVLHDV